MAITLDGDNLSTVGVINSATAKASTSGTSIDFTGIPAGVKRITVMFTGVSTNGTSNYLVQIGAGSVTTSGYLGASSITTATGVVTSNFTTGFGINQGGVGTSVVFHGSLSLFLVTGNTWAASGVMAQSNSTYMMFSSGSIALSGTLDRVRITTVNGTDTFDAGSINILYE